MAPILNLESVTKYFAGVIAVDEVSLSFEEGELIGLIGPNGAGKTTLLSLISGTVSLSAGRIVFKGEDISNTKVHVRTWKGIARTFQIVKPLRNLSVNDNVLIPLLFAGNGLEGKQRRERVDEVLGMVGLAEKKEFLAGELDLQGQKRLELARALVRKPKLLLLDEVMAGLTVPEIEEVGAVIRQVHQSGVTIIMVEHVMKAVMSLAERVVVLHRGRVLASGTPHEVVANPEVIKVYLGHRFAGGDASC